MTGVPFATVPQDSDWETIVCSKLEEMEEVRAYVKNQGIGFRIPYTCDGRPGNYYPDLIVKIDDGRGFAVVPSAPQLGKANSH